MRNPKDACVSYYHHCARSEGYKGNFEDFCKIFIAGKGTYPFRSHTPACLNSKNKDAHACLNSKNKDAHA